MMTTCRLSLLTLLLLLVSSVLLAAPITDAALLERINNSPTAEEYPGADAVWLLRDVDVSVDAAGAVTTRERILLKLLTRDAAALAQWIVPYDKSAEQVEVTVARTLLAGEEYPVEAKLITESSAYSGTGWYDSTVVRNIPLPMAVPGAVLEVETLTRRATPRLPGDLGARIPLQHIYPLLESNISFTLPRDMPLTVRFTGAAQPVITEATVGKEHSYRWRVTKIPALKLDEAWVPPLEEMLGTARVSTLTSWGTVSAWYDKLTTGKAAVTPEIQRVADEKTRGCTSAGEKISVLHKAVRELAYVGIELGGQSDEPHAALQVMLRNYGDCKDKATLLRALLKAAGIESSYVLVRTTDKGILDRKIYGPSEYNHVILVARTPEGDRYLDATDADCPAELLPPLVAGADALIIRGDGELVTLPAPDAAVNSTDIAITATIAPDGKLQGQLKLIYQGHPAAIQRGMLAGIDPEDYTTVLGGLLAPRLGQDVQVAGITVENRDNPNLPLTIAAKFTSATAQIGGTMRLLYLPTFMYQPNPVRNATERRMPLQRRMAASLHLTADYTLPAGWKPLNPPPAVSETSGIGAYHDEVKVAGNILRYSCEMASNRGTYPLASYPDFQRWAGILALEGRNPLAVVLGQ